MPGSFTISQFKRWQDAVAETTPARATAAELADAKIASGLALHMTGDGIMLRFSTETGGQLDIRLNAAMALMLASTIPAAGVEAGWLDDDGIVIALPDPPRRGR